jgi:hypothetical protein
VRKAKPLPTRRDVKAKPLPEVNPLPPKPLSKKVTSQKEVRKVTDKKVTSQKKVRKVTVEDVWDQITEDEPLPESPEGKPTTIPEPRPLPLKSRHSEVKCRKTLISVREVEVEHHSEDIICEGTPPVNKPDLCLSAKCFILPGEAEQLKSLLSLCPLRDDDVPKMREADPLLPEAKIPPCCEVEGLISSWGVSPSTSCQNIPLQSDLTTNSSPQEVCNNSKGLTSKTLTPTPLQCSVAQRNSLTSYPTKRRGSRELTPDHLAVTPPSLTTASVSSSPCRHKTISMAATSQPFSEPRGFSVVICRWPLYILCKHSGYLPHCDVRGHPPHDKVPHDKVPHDKVDIPPNTQASGLPRGVPWPPPSRHALLSNTQSVSLFSCYWRVQGNKFS